MKRSPRALIVALTLVVLVAPRVLDAQQAGKVYRVGQRCPTQCVPTHPLWQPYTQGLRDFGWIEGQNCSQGLGSHDLAVALAQGR